MIRSTAKAGIEAARKAMEAPHDQATGRATARLRKYAGKYGHDLDDLMSWYKDDMMDLGAVPPEQFLLIVGDYVDRREFYRR